MSIYKRKRDGHWVGCVEVPSEDGKRKREYVYAKTQKEAKRLYNELLYKIEHSTFKNNDTTSFESLLMQWFEVHKPKIASTTAELYKMYIDRHIVPALGPIKLKDLKPIKLDKFYNKKLEEGLSPNTVVKFHKLIHQALRYAVKNDMIVTNPSDNVSLPQTVPFKPNVYDEKDFNNLLNVIRGTFDEVPVLLGGAVGLRRGEVFGLRWTDINFKQKTITIAETKVRYKDYTIKKPKTASSMRTIKVYDFVLDVLRDYMNSLKVVPIRVCDKYKPDAYSKHFKKLLEDNNLPPIRFHDLRHYNAILMLKYNIPDKVAAERLGHSDTTMLRKVYQHTLKEMHDDAANKLEAALTMKNVSQDVSHGTN